MAVKTGLIITAPSSGTGKTTVMLGLLRLLRRRGLAIQPYKSGPDYIDPAFHQAASGTPSFNLDSWAMRPELLDRIAAISAHADMVVAEGSMGLFDGVAKTGATGTGASAEIAMRFGWPVVLVVDVSGQAQSAAAVALGFRDYLSGLPFAGVILNRVASPRHEALARRGMELHNIPVLGCLPKRGDLVLPERHLGLIQAVEHPDLETAIDGYADFVEPHIDLDALMQAAASSTSHADTKDSATDFSQIAPPAQNIALAQDEAFSFTYPHLLESWRQQGAEITPFSPLNDECPKKDADLIWLAGGYPELHGGRLAQATSCFDAIRNHAETKAVHGECGGYMVLGEGLIDKEGERHKMLGLLGLVTSFETRKFHLGYRLATPVTTAPALQQYSALRGHEFHYSSIIEQPDTALFSVTDANGQIVAETGSVRAQVSGTFFHLIAEA